MTNTTATDASPDCISDHPITAQSLDQNALDVVAQLNEHGFDAYLVGGCVRDMLCGETPKDFDVATNATPIEVRDIFRRSRLIGRRFPIAHVRYGREIIEVSTFRQGQVQGAAENANLETNDQGLIVRDQAFGTLAEDAFRRDFTVNALYFDVQRHEIIDYVGGMADIADQRLRFIGEPEDRLAEDPVRMLRAIRFAAKLGFRIDDDIMMLVEDTADRLEAIPAARLFDEFLKMFLSGYGGAAWQILSATPLARSLFPTCNPESPLVLDAMNNTDARIAADQPVTPGFLVAILLWDDFCRRNEANNPEGKPGPIYDIAIDTFAVQQQHVALPRRFTLFAREVWQLQPRLVSRQSRNIRRLLEHKRFRAAFDFLTLRAAYEPELDEIAQWWHDIQEVDADTQQAMIDELPSPAKSGRKRRRRRKR